MPSQSAAGKAFEYALINEANRILSPKLNVILVQDDTYKNAEKSFSLFSNSIRTSYITAANAALSHILSLEPKLHYEISDRDILQLQLASDSSGQVGDVRDILFIRSWKDWEIGISAKNNHMAVKHSRLSKTKNFGEDWVGVSCSQNYFNLISPIFDHLQHLKESNAKWSSVKNKKHNIYVPILNAFRDELLRINENNPHVPEKLVSYLLGRNDFYKVIRRAKRVEIYGFNINGNLNRSIHDKSLREVQKLKLPTEIIQFEYRPDSDTTLLLVCNEGWQISFRIHSAESMVIPSLKFDTNLIGQPPSLYSHHITY